MSDLTRRDILQRVAMAIAAAATLDKLDAQEIHHMVEMQTPSGGTYTPASLSAHEYRTVERLADLIIPVENGKPGALEAGAPAWIDMLAGVNAQLKDVYVKGVAWLDTAMTSRGATDFVSATSAQQTAMLDQIAFRRNGEQTPDLQPGIQFFNWVRRMTVDGFYTSRIGMRDIYQGNTALAQFTVPAASLEYALKKSGL